MNNKHIPLCFICAKLHVHKGVMSIDAIFTCGNILYSL